MKVIDRVQVYGLPESIRASKYPMAVNLNKLTDNITPRVHACGACELGTGHDQFLTGIVVQFDLTFSIKAWVEAERYHFLDFVSSQSTMHRITRFDIAEQCNEYVTKQTIENVSALVSAYKATPSADSYLTVLYNVPTGFRLTARITTNYRQLKTIYRQRHDHRLPEWREFCEWVETLPMWKELTQDEREAGEPGSAESSGESKA